MLIAARPGPVSDGLADNPIGIAGEMWVQLGDIGLTLALLALVASLLLGVVAVFARYRRGSGIERAQLRWFLAANVATAVFVTLSFLDGGGDITAFDMLFVLSLSLPPLAVGVAVLRYRLYEIDRIISRGIAYGTAHRRAGRDLRRARSSCCKVRSGRSSAATRSPWHSRPLSSRHSSSLSGGASSGRSTIDSIAPASTPT